MAFTYAGHYDEVLFGTRGGENAPVYVIPNASVTVYESDGATEATLYTDRTKGATAANPVSSDEAGNLEFWADPGNYVLSISVGGSVLRTDNISIHLDFSETPIGTGDDETITGDWTFEGAILPKGHPVHDVKAYGATGDGSTDDTSAIAAAVEAAANRGVVFIPEGTYLVSGTIVDIGSSADGVSVVGSGRGNTIIVLSGDIASPLIDVGGVSGGDHVKRFTMKHLTLWGSASRHSGTLIDIRNADQVNLNDLHLLNTDGSAIYMQEVWDSVVSSVQIEDCGSSSSSSPAVDLQPSDPTSSDSGCNNVVFMDVQVEGARHVGMRWGEHTRKCRLMASKFHGDLPTPSAFYSLHLDGAYANTVVGTIFTNGGDSHVVIEAGPNEGGKGGNVFVGNVLDNCDGWAFDVVDVPTNVFDANAIGRHVANTSGAARFGSGATLNTWGVSNSTSETIEDNTSGVNGSTGRGHGLLLQTSYKNNDAAIQAHYESSSPAAFDGIAVNWSMNNSAGARQVFAQAVAASQDVTDGSEDGDLKFLVVQNGSMAEVARFKSASKTTQLFGALDHDGSTAGFFGAAPASRPSLTYSRSGETVAEAAIRSALATLGLVADNTTA